MLVGTALCRAKEAENARNGIHSPVSVDPRPIEIDIEIRKGRQPPIFHENFRQLVSLSTPVGDDEDGEQQTLLDTIADGSTETEFNAVLEAEADANRERLQQLRGIVEAERPSLSKNELAVLDWKLNPVDQRIRTGKQVAADLGLVPSTVSKISDRLQNQLQETDQK